MIKIIKVESHLGPGVYSMRHESCLNDNQQTFLVNARKSCPVHYNPISDLVDCPWCHTGVALAVILENHENNQVDKGE